jgi:hypothetical protein
MEVSPIFEHEVPALGAANATVGIKKTNANVMAKYFLILIKP